MKVREEGGGSAGGTVKILGGVIVLLVVILIRAGCRARGHHQQAKRERRRKPSESVNDSGADDEPCAGVFGPVGDATDRPTVSGGDAYTEPDSDWSAGFGETTPDVGGEDANAPVPDDTGSAKTGELISKRPRR